MLIICGERLNDYKKENLQMKDSWEKRDFVSCVRSHLQSNVEKVLAIGGLRGTGKTTGALQAAEGFDTCYMLAQKGESEKGADYIEQIKQTACRCVIIDEYSWITDRDALDHYLITAVQNGKRIVITGTESITMDFLGYGALNHRVSVVHTTMFPYGEYLRMHHKTHSKTVCREYLMHGGLFEEYAIKNFESMKSYIEEAVVRNLADYLKNEISEERARTLTYSILYKAICPSNLDRVPVLHKYTVTLDNFLDAMGVNTAIKPDGRELERVADIFEQIGLIVRIRNYDRSSPLSEQYYITNPSLTCQLILAAYGLRDLENSILGHVFESCAMVQLATNKLEEHDIYFLNHGAKKSEDKNKELDIIITDHECEFVYLMECKFREEAKLDPDSTMLSGFAEGEYFPNAEIEGRYVIYNGSPMVKEMKTGQIIFLPISGMLDRYFEFEQNVIDIANIVKEKYNLRKKKKEAENLE